MTMPVSKLDADKNPVRGHVLGNEYISQVNDTSFSYYLNDKQGSDGSIRNHYRYSAFGETITAEETVPNRLRYNGQMADGLTGLYKGKWNQKRMNFIDNNSSATAKDIYQFAGKMMDDYGLSGYKIHPYGGK